MGLLLVQTLLTAAGCCVLWFCWRDVARRGKAAMLIVSAGLLARAVSSEILFWISFLQLPIVRPLQAGGGFWFYAIDAQWYFRYGMRGVSLGLLRFLTSDLRFTSPVFVKLVAVSLAAFGRVPSVSILLNCLAYVVTCMMIVRMGGDRARLSTPALLALASVSLAPSFVLWSTQLLKDTLFVMLLAIAIYAAYRYQQAVEGGESWQRLGVSLVAIMAALYAIAGVRWYFAIVMLAGFALMFLLAIVRSQQKALAISFSVVAIFWMAQMALWGAGNDMPSFVVDVLTPRTALATAARLPASLNNFVLNAAHGYDKYAGSTQIRVGHAVVNHERRVVANSGTTTSTVANATATDGATKVAAPIQPNHAGQAATRKAKRWARVSHAVAAAAPRQSFAIRLFTSAIATFVPRVVGEGLGLIHMGGGRGMWLVADVDTLLFDVIGIAALGYSFLLLRRRRARVTPLFVFVVLVCACVSGPLLYAVSNFGTLFRQRQMISFELCLLPLTLACTTAAPADDPAAVSATE